MRCPPSIALIALPALSALSVLSTLSVLSACAEPAALLVGAEPVVLELADVTPVWPLPDRALGAHAELDALGYLRAAPEDREPMLPRDVFDELPVLTRIDEPDDLYASLTVVAARLDPCFQEGRPEGPLDVLPCEANVRLVLQPIRPPLDDERAKPEARDAALHAFFRADKHEIVDAVRALFDLRVASGVSAVGPLRTHPLLEDTEGRAAVRRILRPLVTADRLVRVTATTVHANDTAWTFSGVDAHDGEWHGIDIATLGSHDQHAISDGGTGTIHALLDPTPAIEDDLSLLLDDADARAATREARQAAYDAAARIENPLLHNPGTVDCGSCHFAAVARRSAEERETMFASEDAFSSAQFDLTPPPAFRDTEVVRVLGYRFRDLAVAPRVIHESALVATNVQHAIDTYDPSHEAEHTSGTPDDQAHDDTDSTTDDPSHD